MDLENITLENTSITNENVSFFEEGDFNWEFYWYTYKYCCWFVITVTVVTFLFGFISWILIRKWRTFKNYAFINISAAAFLKHSLEYTINTSYWNTYDYELIIFYNFYIIAVFAYNLWLFVLCVLFYSTIVDIFKPPVHGRFWKSALFGWGAPMVLGAMNLLRFNSLMEIFNFLDYIVTTSSYFISLVTFILYSIVLWSLLKRSDVRRSSRNLRSKVQMATLLFLMSGVASVACHFFDMMTGKRGVFILVMDNVEMLPSIVVSIWVFIAKSNRTLWQDYYRSRF